MRRDAVRGALRAVGAATVGVMVLARASAAYADMGFRPGFLRDTLYLGDAQTGASLLLVMLVAALSSAVVGIVALRHMARQAPGEDLPTSASGPRDE